ncbi:MAG: type I restriction enzyme HsdR N-terminal domain-containing protein [Saprospiraceae bacterium]|nr:type I restriction enzyme HsdR N-terminal domain-containing protein [Saprospiraceae bacterium]
MNLDLNLHEYKSHLTIKNIDDVKYILDPIRKKYIQLQPEELVRQLLLAYFIHNGIFSKNLIQVEKMISVNQMKKRFDIVIYDQDIQPFLLVEVKSHTVPITQSTLDQVAIYNMTLKAPYLLVTNGVTTYSVAIDFDQRTYEFIDHIPDMTP